MHSLNLMEIEICILLLAHSEYMSICVCILLLAHPVYMSICVCVSYFWSTLYICPYIYVWNPTFDPPCIYIYIYMCVSYFWPTLYICQCIYICVCILLLAHPVHMSICVYVYHTFGPPCICVFVCLFVMHPCVLTLKIYILSIFGNYQFTR